MTVYFDNQVKRYFLVVNKAKVYLSSISELIASCTFSMTPAMRFKAAEKHAKKRKTTTEQILQEWDETYNSAVDHGNTVHIAEAGTIQEISPPNRTAETIEYTYVRLRDLPDGTYRELRLFCDKYYISCRIDYICIRTENGVRKATIRDYKTGVLRDVRTNDVGDPYRMKPPLNKLPDSETGKAMVQLSTYAYLCSLEGVECELELWHKSPTIDSEMLKYLGPKMSEAQEMYQVYQVPLLARDTFFLLNKNKLRVYGSKKQVPQRNASSEIWNR